MTLAVEAASGTIDLGKLADALRGLLAASASQIEQLGRDFESLTKETDAIIAGAGAVVACAEGERLAEAMPAVRLLGSAAGDFIHQRLKGTEDVLQTVRAEERLLQQLERLTRGQKGVVRETGMLRLLTHIEVARLGEVGSGFQYLAHELDEFAQSVARSTAELMEHTEERRRTTGETQRTLAAALPGMREEFARIEEDLGKATEEVEEALAELRKTPGHFQNCVKLVAVQVASVVAAIQSHDLTRQQIEHVAAALTMLAGGEAGSEVLSAGEIGVGLTIQGYQLRCAAQTIEGWLGQLRTSLGGIGQIASSQLLHLGRVVTQQEGAVSAQLTRIERVEAACEAGDARVQASFAGIAGLMQLVDEHLERARAVRDRLQLLMFNSIVEASHLGAKADGILEISKTIKSISATWGTITVQSEQTTAEIRSLVEASHSTVEAFSEAGYAGLREARAATASRLAMMREAARCAEAQGRLVETAVLALQGRLAQVSATGDRLEAGFRQLQQVVKAIESEGRRVEQGGGYGDRGYDARAVERHFGAEYTAEVERRVLRAALAGEPMPAMQASFGGNDVELF
jgi:hypothetical protein